MFNTIKQIQPKSSGGGGGVTREEKVYAMSTDILGRLPPTFDIFRVKERYTITIKLKTNKTKKRFLYNA